jgi:Cof subfamily protein (haloacid dehalogenase superfamily)
MIELAIFDLDGTLLDNDHELSDENVMAINKLHKNGCKIAIATGRPRILVTEYKEKLLACDFTITCNGAMIENEKTGKLLKNVLIDKDVVKKLVEKAKETNSICMVYTEKYIITEYNYRVELFEERNKKLQKKHQVEFIISSDAEYISENFKVNKVLMIEEDKMKNSFLYSEIEKFHELSVTRSNDSFIDIMGKGVDKKEAVEFLGEYLNIKPENMLAMGDNLNDLGMLQYVGCAVTTSNAVDEVKKEVKFVSSSNNESGVAVGINKILKDEQMSKRDSLS